VFEARGRDADSITSVTTAEYAAGKSPAPRPRHSVLSLDKIISAGFRPVDAMTQLQEYLSSLS
jgi:dTDP-4-dehydrorhamnose 3,5-epimerase